jgi:hypothetical protein
VVSGTIVYWHFEDWTIIEALYFSVATLTTVGYGDFAPTTAGTQIFTIVYLLTGISVFVALLASVAQQYIAQKAEGGQGASAWRASFETASRHPRLLDARKRACHGEAKNRHQAGSAAGLAPGLRDHRVDQHHQQGAGSEPVDP